MQTYATGSTAMFAVRFVDGDNAAVGLCYRTYLDRYERRVEGTAKMEDKTMNLSIPGFPFEMVVTVIRKPQVSRGKLSLRGLLLLVMFLTIFTWFGIRVFDRYA
jgi:hypothetical protein